MRNTRQDRLLEDVKALAAKHGSDRGALLSILQGIQGKYQEISDFAMQAVADLLEIHPVEVYSVVTFYHFLKRGGEGRFVIRLCRTISCDMADKDAVAVQLENDLGISFGETTGDGRFTLEWANCLGMCDQGPALLVNEQVFTHVTPDRVPEILEACRKAFGPHTLQEKGVVL